MGQKEPQNLLKLSQFTKSHILKKITQLLVSVSVISLFLSNDTVFSLIHSLNVYFSTFPVKLFSHTIDKNCIFLLCNGLLVFVTKYSALSSSCSSPRIGRSSYRSFKDYTDDIPLSESEMPVLKKSVLAECTAEDLKSAAAVEEEIEKEYVIEEAEEREPQEPNLEDEEGGGETGVSSVTRQGGETESLIEEDGQIVVEMVDNEYLMQEQQEEDDDDDDGNDDDVEEGNGLLSTEELNKKFDEFIRKMKEEIRIEGQQQQLAVMVN